MKNDRKKRVGLVAIMLTALLSCFAIGATTARYFSETKGTGSVSVAKWDVSVSPAKENTETPTFTFDNENSTAEYAFSVTSNSEVALSYDVVITLPTALEKPDSVSFAIGENTATVSGNVYTISNVGTFAASGGTNTHILKIMTDEERWYRIDMSGITVQVVAEQIS